MPGALQVAQFYGTAEWREARAAAVARQGRVCRICGDRDGPFDVDHIVPLTAQTWHGRALPENLQVLCRACHLRKHRG